MSTHTKPFTIRDAHAGDLPGILAIYNTAVEGSTAVWNDRTVDLANRAAWMEGRQAQGHPVLVATDPAAAVLGYASYGDWRAFDGYRFTVEHSIYVSTESRGAGLGRALLTALIDRARASGKHAMVGAIEAGNGASIRLHESLGFERIGTFPQVGAKFGRWLDLSFLMLLLDDRQTPVEPAP